MCASMSEQTTSSKQTSLTDPAFSSLSVSDPVSSLRTSMTVKYIHSCFSTQCASDRRSDSAQVAAAARMAISLYR